MPLARFILINAEAILNEWQRFAASISLPHLRVVSHVENKGLELFDEVVRPRLEGVMAKRADSTYVAGRSRV